MNLDPHVLSTKLARISSSIDRWEGLTGERLTGQRIEDVYVQSKVAISKFSKHPSPRASSCYNDVREALMRTAIEALIAYEHITENNGLSMTALAHWIDVVEKEEIKDVERDNGSDPNNSAPAEVPVPGAVVSDEPDPSS